MNYHFLDSLGLGIGNHVLRVSLVGSEMASVDRYQNLKIEKSTKLSFLAEGRILH